MTRNSNSVLNADSAINYNKAKKLTNFGVTKNCPNCKKTWKPQPPPLTILQEGWLGAKRMALKYHKTCEFCGYTHIYYE